MPFRIILIFFLFVINFSIAQEALVIDWQTVIGGERNELAYSGVETTDGGFMVVGSTNSKNSFDVKTSYGFDGNGGNDFWICKLSATGALEWTKTFGGSLDDVATSIVKTPNNEYLILGTTLSTDGDANFNGVNGGLLLIRLKLNGDVVSKRLFAGGNRNNEPGFLAASNLSKPVIKLLSNGQIMIGATYLIGKIPFTSYDFYIAQLTPNGDTLWEKTYGGGLEDYLNDLIITSDSGILMVGSTLSLERDISGAGKGFYDFLAIKTDVGGKELWKKAYGGLSYDVLFSALELDNKSEYILVGESSSTDGVIGQSFGEKDGMLLKIDLNGNLLFRTHMGGKDNDGFYAVLKGKDNLIYLFGTSESQIGTVKPRGPKTDVWMCAIEATTLQEKYHKLFGGADIDLSKAVSITSKGEILVAGSSRSTDGDVKLNRGQSDFWLIRLAPPPPVIFGRFDAWLTEKEEIALEWTSTYEKDAQFYYLEKSIDNKNFNQILEEFAFGSSNLTRYYRFIDKNPYLGKTFYRVRYSDKSNNYFPGPSTSFTFVPLNTEPSNSHTFLRAFPNPFTEYFNLNTNLENPIISLFDPQGKEISFESIEMGDKSYKITPYSKMSSGIYLLKISNLSESHFQRIVIIR